MKFFLLFNSSKYHKKNRFERQKNYIHLKDSAKQVSNQQQSLKVLEEFNYFKLIGQLLFCKVVNEFTSTFSTTFN